ncbi:hypothetical protein [Streptomyces sp. S4.7]|uniref:hypothetical protein n=1 Tax=Streptomyces sp. S4.7 TaxID=2705439 RepID=UPI0013D9B4B2|nr:hypothetical protein [Streptomyces sp. S4.7]
MTTSSRPARVRRREGWRGSLRDSATALDHRAVRDTTRMGPGVELHQPPVRRPRGFEREAVRGVPVQGAPAVESEVGERHDGNCGTCL